jgi:predicted glycosyltransferase
VKILIDIGHPAHVHLFSRFAGAMLSRGHAVLFTCREKEFEIRLLQYYGFRYQSFGRKYNSLPGKMLGLVQFGWKEWMAGRSFKPDLLLSHGSIYAAHAAALLRKPHIALEDTFNPEQVRLYKPFTEVILTGDYDHPLHSPKVIRYAGYHELAYLHPGQFRPDPNVLSELGLATGQPYAIIRFVSWKASHDTGHIGISMENKLKAVELFSKHARVFITSEGALPESLAPFRLPAAPHRVHHVLAFASLLFGESSTMAEEAAMLGIPAIYLFNNSTYYTRHLESKYRLMHNYSESPADQQKAIDQGLEILRNPGVKQEWQQRRETMLADRIDVTAFLVWFIENYPGSREILRADPSFQLTFRTTTGNTE